LLVLGHPGSGKTTLASTICYRNALEGRGCLYISFYEDKDRFFKYMRGLGLDLASAESEGLLRFVRLPVPTKVDSIVDVLNALVSAGEHKVVVIDSLNPVLAGSGDSERRAWLTNYLYNLAQLNNGLVVLVAELPYGLETTETAEFVADAVLVLKSEVEEGFLVRKLEVRKARGYNISLAEIPFSITGGRGFEVSVPPVLGEIPAEVGEVELPCEALKQVWGSLRRGFVVDIYHPTDSDFRDLFTFLLATAVANNMRILFLSYRYSPRALTEIALERAEELGIERAVSEKLMKERVVFVSMNPFSRSTTQLAIDELQLVDSVRPDAVVFHGVELLWASTPSERYVREVYNQLNYLKSRGLLVLRVGRCIDEQVYNREAIVADAVMKLSYAPASYGTLKYEAFLWRRGKPAVGVSPEELEECFKECSKALIPIPHH
jgi:circadian clock protein KaiC